MSTGRKVDDLVMVRGKHLTVYTLFQHKEKIFAGRIAAITYHNNKPMYGVVFDEFVDGTEIEYQGLIHCNQGYGAWLYEEAFVKTDEILDDEPDDLDDDTPQWMKDRHRFYKTKGWD